MNLRDLEYLVALDEQRHFGKAAARCGVSQPTLSTQLRKLETELGVDLIERNHRQVLLTAAGTLVAARARVILSHAADIRRIAAQAAEPATGALRLGAFPTLAPYLLPHAVPLLHQRFPQLELLLVEERSGLLLDRLRAGNLDAALLALPIVDDLLQGETLFREEFVLALPADHRLAVDDAPVQAEELANEPLLLLEEGHCLRDQALAFCELAGSGERTGFQATSLETLRHMVGAGVGLTVLPELAVSHPVQPSPGVVLRRFADPAPHRDIALIWRRSTAYPDLLHDIAAVLRDLPVPVLTPLG